MYNWFENKDEIKNKTINSIMFENKDEIKNKTINSIMSGLEYLFDETRVIPTANYWIDDTHNVFVFIEDNGNDDRWIEIHDCNGDIIGDLFVLDTDDVNRERLLEEIKAIVDAYYGD